MPAASRRFFEPRFGHDFGAVRVHDDDDAHAAARRIDASAYTRGTDVVFARGQYEPGSRSGQRLIAHELAHVVQNARRPERAMKLQRQPATTDRSLIEQKVNDIVERLEGFTWESDGEAILAIFRGLSPEQQRQALAELRSRAESMHESREGPLFRLFEDVSEQQRDELARMLFLSGALSQSDLQRLYPGRTWAGRWLPVTTQAGSDLAQWGADLAVRGDKEGGAKGALQQLAGGAIGIPASLWTPDTATETIATLTLLRVAKPLVAAFPRAAGYPLATLAGAQTGLSIGTLITGTDLSGEPLNDADRLRHWLLAAAGIATIAAGVLQVFARPGTATTSARTLTPEETAEFFRTHELIHTTPEGVEVWAPRGTPAELTVPANVRMPVPPPPPRIRLRLRGRDAGPLPGGARDTRVSEPANEPPRLAAPAPPAPASATTAGSGSSRLQGITAGNRTIWRELQVRAETPVPRQSEGGFRSSPTVREGNRAVVIIEGRVGPQISQDESLAHYSTKLSGEHGTHAVGLQLGENLPEGITSAPGRFNISEMKVVENAIRETADEAALWGAIVETRTMLMIEYAWNAAGETTAVLVGIERTAWLEMPASVGARTIPFAEFEAHLDPTTRATVVVRDRVLRPPKASP